MVEWSAKSLALKRKCCSLRFIFPNEYDSGRMIVVESVSLTRCATLVGLPSALFFGLTGEKLARKMEEKLAGRMIEDIVWFSRTLERIPRRLD